MKHLKRIAVSALAMAAFAVPIGAGSASATTLEVEGVTQNKSVSFNVKVPLAGSTVLSRTDGVLANTCKESRVRGTTESPFSGTQVRLWAVQLSWGGCSAGNPTVHQNGQLYVEHEFGTTNGKVFSENAEVTFPTSLGFTVNCKTGSGTQIGTLTGTSGGWSTMHVNAVLNCGFLLPSASWKGTYETTWAEGLGVSP